jgi:hypothetical protein
MAAFQIKNPVNQVSEVIYAVLGNHDGLALAFEQPQNLPHLLYGRQVKIG